MRFLLPMIVLAVVAILPDMYITKAFLKDSSLYVKLLQWLPTILFFFGILGLQIGGAESNWAIKLFFAVVLCFMLPKLFFVILSLLGRLIHLQGAFNLAGATFGVLFLICAAYGMTIGWKTPVVREVDLHFENLPESFEGYTIVQISDWHLGTYRPHPQTIRKEIELANEANADAIVFTGDIINGNPVELEPFREMLSTLKSKDGVFSIMGNHDYCMYGSDHTPEGIRRNIEIVQDMERSFGWNLLLNENKLITRGSDTLAIVGVENDGTPPFPQYADLDKAQSGTDGAAFKVLLSHDPTHWRRSVLPDTDIDLTLSGHTHAMQFKVLGFSPSRFAYKEWGGLYEEGQRKLYVSTGSGGNVAFRFGAWPEIIKITLHTCAGTLPSD
ncbi:MAG: metallophosphoesterase [Bacteroidales bacterium]|nr:metallophosphoesterase [Bacteroidales bacterium]